MENLRNRTDVKLVGNKNGYLRWSSKLMGTSYQIFDDTLVDIGKSKVTLTLKKPAYIRTCMLHLSKVLMYEFHYDDIEKNMVTTEDTDQQFTGTDSLMHETKTKDFYVKEMFDFNNYSAKSK